MPPPTILDPSELQTDRVLYDRAAIYARMPHRFEFELLDGICLIDTARQISMAYLDCRADAWWTRGHIPGRPILPGVLQLEAAAQLLAFVTRYADGFGEFVAFGGVEDCRFRLAVEPPSRLVLVAKVQENRSRRIIGSVQGFVGDQMAIHAVISGLAMR
jgi:3-hydroxyacyl-[acyl-carrier-protein] dehydratase